MRIVGNADLGGEQPGLRLIEVAKSMPCGLRSEIILFSYWTPENTGSSGRDVLSSHVIDQKVARLFSELLSLVCCWGFLLWIYSPDTQALEVRWWKKVITGKSVQLRAPFLNARTLVTKFWKCLSDYLYSGNVSLVCPELLIWDSGTVIKIH